MTAFDASSVAALLREFGQRSALRGGNPFRAKAYARAADSLLALSIPLEIVIAQDRLQEIPGVGEAIADIIKNAPRDQVLKRPWTLATTKSKAAARPAYLAGARNLRTFARIAANSGGRGSSPHVARNSLPSSRFHAHQ